MAVVSMRFGGTVTNNGVPVAGTVTVTTTSTPAGVSGQISAAGHFSVYVNVSSGDTATLTVDCGEKFTSSTTVAAATAGQFVDLSIDIGSGSASAIVPPPSGTYVQTDALVLRPEDHGIFANGTDQSAAFAALITSLNASAGTTMCVLQLGAGSYRCDSGLTWDPRYFDIIGGVPGQSTLDFSNLASGAAVTLQAAAQIIRSVPSMRGVTLKGPQGGSTTAGVHYGGVGFYANQITHPWLSIDGFGYQIDMYDNTWGVQFIAPFFTHSQQAIWRVSSGSANMGENLSVVGGVFANAAKEILLVNNPCQIACFGTSFDYSGRFVNMTNGRVRLVECWMEGNNASIATLNPAEMFYVSDAAGTTHPQLEIIGGTMVPLWSTITEIIAVDGNGGAYATCRGVSVYTDTPTYFSGPLVSNIGTGNPVIVVDDMKWSANALSVDAMTTSTNGDIAIRQGHFFKIVRQVDKHAVSVMFPNGNQLVLATMQSAAAPAAYVQDTAAAHILDLDSVASSVNYLAATPAATGSGPALAARGTDTNIDLKLTPKGTGVLRTPAGSGLNPNGVNHLFVPGAVGKWYVNPLLHGVRTLVPTQSTMLVYVFQAGPDGVTIDQLDINVTVVGSAGAVTRAGLYLVTDQDHPFKWASGTAYASLLVDAGTVATDAGTGQKTYSPTAQVISPYQWFGVAGVDQVATPATRTVGGSSGAVWPSPFGSSQAAGYGGATGLALTVASITGALPATFTPTGVANTDCGVGIHRSA